MKYPLFFTYTDLVDVDGTRVVVEARGRCLIGQDDGDWWIEGVEPGGLAAGGEIPHQAILNFRRTWMEVLADCAHGKTSVAAFEAEVDRMFKQTSVPAAAEWAAAREQIRMGCSIEEPFREMEKVEKDVRAFYRVRLMPELSTTVKDSVYIPVERDKAA